MSRRARADDREHEDRKQMLQTVTALQKHRNLRDLALLSKNRCRKPNTKLATVFPTKDKVHRQSTTSDVRDSRAKALSPSSLQDSSARRRLRLRSEDAAKKRRHATGDAERSDSNASQAMAVEPAYDLAKDPDVTKLPQEVRNGLKEEIDELLNCCTQKKNDNITTTMY